MDVADGRSVDDFFSAFAYEPTNPFPIDKTVQSQRRQALTCAINRTNTMLAASSSSTASPGGGKPVVVSRFFLPSHAPSSLLTDAKSSRSRAPHAKAIGSQSKKRRARKEPVAYFSAAEKKSEIYRRVADNNLWDPPRSNHHLLQELHSFDPWRILTICILLNITAGIQVRRVLPSLFLLCPNAEAMSKVDEEEVENVIRPLGLQKKRAKMLKKFSCEYLRKDWVYVTQLHGIGKYAADAYAIFCAGKIEEVNPRDHKLVDYWKFLSPKK